MTVDYLALTLRVVHILAAITAAGGTIFLFRAGLPAMQTLSHEARAAFHDALRSRWAVLLHAAILFLLVSGLWNYVATIRAYEVPRAYHMLFGVKFLLAMIVFAVAILLSGRSALADKLRADASRWLGLNTALLVAIVVISGVLRQASCHAPPKVAAQMEISVDID